MNEPLRQQLREIIGVSSHLDGLLCEHGSRLPPDVAAILQTDFARIGKELAWLSDDLEPLVIPKRKRPAGAASR